MQTLCLKIGNGVQDTVPGFHAFACYYDVNSAFMQRGK